MKKDKNAYIVLILLSVFYMQNVFRLKTNSLKERIKNIQEMNAYYKKRPSTFKGDKNFYLLSKPLALCGIVAKKNIVLELTDLEILNIYEESGEPGKMQFPFSYHDQYIIKDGQILISGLSEVSRLLNKAYFYQDDRDIFLVNPGVMLTNSNCFRVNN